MMSVHGNTIASAHRKRRTQRYRSDVDRGFWVSAEVARHGQKLTSPDRCRDVLLVGVKITLTSERLTLPPADHRGLERSRRRKRARGYMEFSAFEERLKNLSLV